MAKMQPWYKIITPREDLREGKPLDAAEFAVHLDQVREGRGSEEYHNPVRFLERTFLTKNLTDITGEVVRRLSGEKTATSAVFNMATQFGGGKTHALTLLYHLATQGPKATKWPGVGQILEKGGVTAVPEAATAVFVGTEFDSLTGRGGNDGTPFRRTPWGEIAFQLGGESAFKAVEKHDREFIEPKGDVIRQFLPKNRPSLILMDEIINYVSTYRGKGYHNKLYNFIQTLSETVRGEDRVVLLVSIPASEHVYAVEDEQDEQRFKKMLDRLGKAVLMSAETETAEIIRRRLFEWDPKAIAASGRVMLPRAAVETCTQYANWLNENRPQIPSWFSIDQARKNFEDTYPFHPMVLSVFERKWQELPRFQRTRAILRLLAMWVSHSYLAGYKGAHRDPLIGQGTAPLEDPLFRSAVFEQLGEDKLEGAITTDIAGKADSHAVRLDEEAVDTIRKTRLHRKVATTIFFESNGGQTRTEATVPEIRLAVAGPDIDLGNVETTLEAMTENCYYLTSERNRYYFSLKENLNKRYADRRASIRDVDIDSRIKEEIQKIFPVTEGFDRRFFPELSAQIPDVPSITFLVMGPEQSMQDDPEIRKRIESMTREHGKSARTYKSALIWIVPDSSAPLREAARKLLAWEDIRDEGLKLDEAQQRQLNTHIERSRRDLTESVWRGYKSILLLGKDNNMKSIDMGLVTSSAAETMPKHILSELWHRDEVVKDVPPRFLIKNWPPAFTEWSTKSVRDAFYASPQFQRLLYPETIRETIARGVREGQLAYVAKKPNGSFDPFLFETDMNAADVEISEDTFILTEEEARKHLDPSKLEHLMVIPVDAQLKPDSKHTFAVEGLDQYGNAIDPGKVTWKATGGTIKQDGVLTAGPDEGSFLVTAIAEGKTATASVCIAVEPPPPPPPSKRSNLVWRGEVPPQKWSQLYMKVLTRLVSSGDVKLLLEIEASPKAGVRDQLVDEVRTALRGLGLSDAVDVE